MITIVIDNETSYLIIIDKSYNNDNNNSNNNNNSKNNNNKNNNNDNKVNIKRRSNCSPEAEAVPQRCKSQCPPSVPLHPGK